MNRLKNKNKKQGLLMRLLSESLIIGLLLRFADLLYDGLKKSLVGGIFTSYDSIEKTAENSLTAGLLPRLGLDETVRKIKYFINRQFENSFFLGLISKGLHLLLDVQLRQYGVFLFTYGTYSSALYIASYYIESFETLPILNLYLGGGLMLVSFPAMFVKKSLSQSILGSWAMNILLFNILGVQRSSLESNGKLRSFTVLSFIIGTVTGIMTCILGTLYMPLILVLFVGAVLLVTIPETGVLIILFALPFLPTMVLAALIIVVCMCYMLKLIRGKRTLKLEIIDFAVMLFMLLMALGGVISVKTSGSLKPALLYVCLMLGYFLIIGLIRSKEWVMRCVGALIGGSLFVALYGIYENFFGMAQSTWHDEALFEEISGRVVSTFENPNVLAEYLIMVLPFILTIFLVKKGTSYKTAALICGGAAGLCLIFTWSRGAWLGIMFGVLVYFLIYSRKTMLAFAVGICAIPFLPFVLPASIVNRFLSIGNLKDTSTNYRVNIWRAVVNMVADHFGGGIGVGTEAFATVYPEYSLAGIESAPHSHNLYLQIIVELGIVGLIVFLAVIVLIAMINFSFYSLIGKDEYRCDNDSQKEMKLLAAAAFCGIIGILLQGMTDHIWYNYRVFCMFWLVLGLNMAIRRTGTELMTSAEIPDTSVDIYYEE